MIDFGFDMPTYGALYIIVLSAYLFCAFQLMIKLSQTDPDKKNIYEKICHFTLFASIAFFFGAYLHLELELEKPVFWVELLYIYFLPSLYCIWYWFETEKILNTLPEPKPGSPEWWEQYSSND